MSALPTTLADRRARMPEDPVVLLSLPEEDDQHRPPPILETDGQDARGLHVIHGRPGPSSGDAPGLSAEKLHLGLDDRAPCRDCPYLCQTTWSRVLTLEAISLLAGPAIPLRV